MNSLDAVHLQLDYMAWLFVAAFFGLILACAMLLKDFVTNRSAKQPGSSQK